MLDATPAKESRPPFGLVVYLKHWATVAWTYVGGCLSISILLLLVLRVFVARVVGPAVQCSTKLVYNPVIEIFQGSTKADSSAVKEENPTFLLSTIHLYYSDFVYVTPHPCTRSPIFSGDNAPCVALRSGEEAIQISSYLIYIHRGGYPFLPTRPPRNIQGRSQ